jgi:alpha-glucosidase
VLKDLPVFVREGSILPLQPLTQSTNEIPNGPLTVRVYPGKDCQGSLYQDDGNTMAYTHGEFLRLNFSCEQSANSIKFQIGPHEGSYKPWWKELHVEVYGWNASSSRVTGDKMLVIKSVLDRSRHMVSFTVPDNVAGEHLEIGSQR